MSHNNKEAAQRLREIANGLEQSDSGPGEEMCHRCDRRVGLVWRAPIDLWREFVGFDSADVVLCPGCFDNLAFQHNKLLVWEPRLHDTEGTTDG